MSTLDEQPPVQKPTTSEDRDGLDKGKKAEATIRQLLLESTFDGTFRTEAAVRHHR